MSLATACTGMDGMDGKDGMAGGAGPMGSAGPAGPAASGTGAMDTPVKFKVKLDNIAPWTVLKSGATAIPVGAAAAGPIGPGGAYEIELTAGKKQSFSFVSMLGESNDWSFAPGPDGIALYDIDGMPISGDVTSQIKLWDAGTEVDQEPGVGADVGPKQASPTQGAADPNNKVRMVPALAPLTAGGTFALPAITDMIKVTVMSKGGQRFVIRIENSSTASTLMTSLGDRPVHLSPPVWASHVAMAPFFKEGTVDRGQGLEYVAESGRFGMLLDVTRELTGLATGVSPGVWAVHQSGEPFYSLGLMDRGQGLADIAESGRVKMLAERFATTLPKGTSSAGAFTKPMGASADGPAAPGKSFEFMIEAKPGEYLSLATMFGWSNDWLFATAPMGLPLFDAHGMPRAGDVTSGISLYDVGSELNQEPAIGPDTAPQQSAPEQGAADPIDQVRLVSSAEYSRPSSAHLRVTLTPM